MSILTATAVLAIVALPFLSRADAQPTPAATSLPQPTCAQTLDSLDSKTRQNYAGFLLEVRGARRTAYDSLLAVLKRDASAASLDRCYPLLARYTEWYDDPHVFVFQNQTTDSATANRRRRAVRRIAMDEAAIRHDLEARRALLDPIEGIWYDGPTRFGVIRDPDGTPGRFVALQLAPDTAGWSVGDVRARFTRKTDSSYATTLLTHRFAELELTARIHRRVVLRLSPGMWGKAFPVSTADAGTIDPTDVHRPHITIRPRSVVVSVTSHDPAYAQMLDRLVAAADTAIRRTRLLIVDLRGNEGGAAFMTRSLNPYVASTERRASPYDSGNAVVLSSPAQMAYARRLAGNDTSAFVRDLLARMQAHPGQLVPIEEAPAPPAPEPSLPGDWRVIVLVDRGTVSAAEVLVLNALRSTRAIVVGENTAGALDYQSVQIIGLGVGDRRWALGYPTITAHAELPRRGMRGRGIAPTERLVWDNIPNPIAYVEQRFGAPPS